VRERGRGYRELCDVCLTSIFNLRCAWAAHARCRPTHTHSHAHTRSRIHSLGLARSQRSETAIDRGSDGWLDRRGGCSWICKSCGFMVCLDCKSGARRIPPHLVRAKHPCVARADPPPLSGVASAAPGVCAHRTLRRGGRASDLLAIAQRSLEGSLRKDRPMLRQLGQAAAQAHAKSRALVR
jgi:hypothetical protein